MRLPKDDLNITLLSMGVSYGWFHMKKTAIQDND